MFCNKCKEYKGLTRCDRCYGIFCAYCFPIVIDIVVDICDHEIVEEI